MSDKKPFIAARLRNPAEVASEAPVKKAAGFDFIGNIAALIALVLSGITLLILKGDLDLYTQYLQ